MKKIIILSILLNTGHAYSIKPEEAIIITGIFGSFIAAAICEAYTGKNDVTSKKVMLAGALCSLATAGIYNANAKK